MCGMLESSLDRGSDHSFRNRIRDDCIVQCPRYLVLRAQAEAEQEKINAARAAGKNVTGSYVKLICPHNPGVECPAFVHAPTIVEVLHDTN